MRVIAFTDYMKCHRALLRLAKIRPVIRLQAIHQCFCLRGRTGEIDRADNYQLIGRIYMLTNDAHVIMHKASMR